MTKQEILTKAMEKAVRGGFHQGLVNTYLHNPSTTCWTAVIFDHDFAKAFWGKDLIKIGEVEHFIEANDGDIEDVLQVAWQHHLQQMVLTEEPYRYLEKFL